jgi:hypothetical protein
MKKGYDVYLPSRAYGPGLQASTQTRIDTVFSDNGSSAADVRQDLVDKKFYDPEIVVVDAS